MQKSIVLIIQSCSWALFNKQWEFIQKKYSNREFWLFTTQKITDVRFQRIISVSGTKRLNPWNHLLTIMSLNLQCKFHSVVCLYADTYGIEYSNIRILMSMIQSYEKKALNIKNRWIDIHLQRQLSWDILEEIQFIHPNLFLRFLKIVLQGKHLLDHHSFSHIHRKSPRKITFLTGSLVSGGVEVLLLTMAQKFQERGYQVQLISISGGRLIDDFRKKINLLHIYHKGVSDDIFSLRHIGWCLKRLEGFQPDILMVFQFRPFLPGLIAGTLAGVPVMLKSENVSSDIAGPFIERQMTILEEMYDRVIAVSEAVKRRLHWLKDDKCKVIFGTNVETQVFSKIKINKVTDDRPLEFLTVARLAPEKGIEYLLEAADAVIKKGCKVHFSIVGEGKLHDSLIDLRDSLGLREHVEFLGYRNDIPDLLGKCDGFILPSLIEGLPLVIMEAMMAGRCVIATAVDGTPEIITHMENGLLVEPRNVEQLTSAIEMLSSNPELIPKLGEQARKKAQADLNADTMMDQLEALFQEEWAKKR